MKSLVILVRHKRVKRDFSPCLRYIPISFQKYDFPMGAFTYDVTCLGGIFKRNEQGLRF